MSCGSVAFTPLSRAAWHYLMLRVMTGSKKTGDSSLSSQISFRHCFFPTRVSCPPRAHGPEERRFPSCQTEGFLLSGAAVMRWRSAELRPRMDGSAQGGRAAEEGPRVPGWRREQEGCRGTGRPGHCALPWEGAPVLPWEHSTTAGSPQPTLRGQRGTRETPLVPKQPLPLRSR